MNAPPARPPSPFLKLIDSVDEIVEIAAVRSAMAGAAYTRFARKWNRNWERTSEKRGKEEFHFSSEVE